MVYCGGRAIGTRRGGRFKFGEDSGVDLVDIIVLPLTGWGKHAASGFSAIMGTRVSRKSKNKMVRFGGIARSLCVPEE